MGLGWRTRRVKAKEPPLRVAFDRRIKLEFHGARITSDGGLLAYRELDDALGLTAMAASALGEGRRGRNIRHHLLGLLRQAVYGRLAGYEDVNDAERLARDPVMRAIVGREGIDRPAASTSQMGRFETEWLASEANLAALTDLSGAWIDRVHQRRPPDGIILDMDSFCHWAVEGNGFLCWAVEGSGSVASTGRHASVRDPRWGGHMRRSARRGSRSQRRGRRQDAPSCPAASPRPSRPCGRAWSSRSGKRPAARIRPRRRFPVRRRSGSRSHRPTCGA